MNDDMSKRRFLNKLGIVSLSSISSATATGFGLSVSGMTANAQTSPPPPPGSPPDFGQFRAELSKPLGSKLIGFNQGLTGAIDRDAEDKLRDFLTAKDFGAISDSKTDDTEALIRAAKSAGAKMPRPLIIIPPGTAYDFNRLVESPDVPPSAIFFDQSLLGGYRSNTYNQGIIGFIEKGTPDSTIDTNFSISSGHNASLRLENTGKAGSTSGKARVAYINWGAGRFSKGAMVGAQKTIARVGFQASQRDAHDSWQFNLRALAPWQAVTTDWFIWSAGTRGVREGDICYSSTSKRWYQATTAGTTGSSAPRHASGPASDGGVSWTPIEYATDSAVFIVDDKGRISTNGSRGSFSYRLKQSKYVDSNHSLALEATAPDRSVSLHLLPTGTDGKTVPIPILVGSAKSGLQVISADHKRELATFSELGFSAMSVLKPSVENNKNESTPSVRGVSTLILANSASTDLIDLVESAPDQEVTLIAKTGNTTVLHNNKIRLSGSKPIKLSPFSTLTLRRLGSDTIWVEISRSIV